MNKESYKFEVVFLKEAVDFLLTLDKKSQKKVLENIRIARFKTDPELFKKVYKEIWEFRTRYSNKQLRLLAFWVKNKEAIVICTHGFIKKSSRLPNKELKKAKKIRSIYFNQNKKE